MIIHDIKITNFKSIYGTQTLDFDNCKGLIKLSGPIGAGKTTIAEAILCGLFGQVNEQRVGDLTAWNMKQYSIELNLTSKGKKVNIKRNIDSSPLTVTVDGKVLAASNKRDMQAILEEEIYDVPKLAVVKMCVISFNDFGSLAKMTSGETKQFLDNVFGFKLFTDYNNVVVAERKEKMNQSIRLKSVYDETESQIERLREKKQLQQRELESTIDTQKLSEERQQFINEGIKVKDEKTKFYEEMNDVLQKFDVDANEYYKKMTEVATLGRQVKNQYNTLKSGKCPTCGAEIEQHTIDDYKREIDDYADKYREYEHKRTEELNKKRDKQREYEPVLQEFDDKLTKLRQNIQSIDSQINTYNSNLKLINENYDELIHDAEEKMKSIDEQLSTCDVEIGEWNDMNELFTKTLRFNLIDKLIPSINRSIQFFIDKLEQPFTIKFDQEFKAHIMVDSFDKEIRYANLSTGQRKSLDLAIIFGILQNVIAGVNFNVLVLDELFSNMDANARNTMLTLLNESLTEDKTIFIINHAEMSDDYFTHKIRVSISNKKIQPDVKGAQPTIVKASSYEQIF